jgi:hypothetical protein
VFSKTTGHRPVSFLSIDVPNITKTLPLGSQVNWKRLAKAMLRNDDLRGTDFVYGGVYDTGREEAEEIAARIMRTFSEFGDLLTTVDTADIELVARESKDIDSHLMTDIMAVIGKQGERLLFERHERGANIIQVRHILVSGDGDYLDAYRSAFDTYDGNPRSLELEVIVYAWKGKLNPQLAQFATKIYALEDVPRFYHAPTFVHQK